MGLKTHTTACHSINIKDIFKMTFYIYIYICTVITHLIFIFINIIYKYMLNTNATIFLANIQRPSEFNN